jgi:hypothetical protein
VKDEDSTREFIDIWSGSSGYVQATNLKLFHIPVATRRASASTGKCQRFIAADNQMRVSAPRQRRAPGGS